MRRNIICFVVVLAILVSSCELFNSREKILQSKWAVENVDIPSAEIEISLANVVVQKSSLVKDMSNLGNLGFLQAFALEEIKKQFKEANLEFQEGGNVILEISGLRTNTSTWQLDTNKEKIIITIKEQQIPFTIQEISKEKLVLVYELLGQKMTLYLTQFKNK